MKVKKKSIICLISMTLLVIVTLICLIERIYAANVNHYALDVVKENATSSDDNLRITESIIKPSGEKYFNSQKLNYEIALENISVSDNEETQVAIVIDGSESMITNDSADVIRATANDLATGIINNVNKSRVSISNNDAIKLNMTDDTTAITNAIDALALDNQEDSNSGLDNGYASFTSASAGNGTVNKYIIVFTDASDNVTAKMQSLVAQDENLKIISILVDATSTYYYSNNIAVCGDVYLLLGAVNQSDVTNNVEIYDPNIIYDELNRTNKSITVTNVFSNEIQQYFTVSDYTVDNGTIVSSATGYEWTINELNGQSTAKLNFVLTLNTNMNIDADVLFEDLYTNSTQEVQYQTYEGTAKTLNGTDSRENADSTIIQIGKGYDLKIKAVSESNVNLPIEGIEFKVVGLDSDNNEICNITKTTDADGYIVITEDEEIAMRIAGITTFTVTPTVNVVGYAPTNSVTFEITNNVLGELSYNDNGLNLQHNINLDERAVEVSIPIATKKFSLEVNLFEEDNQSVQIGNVEFRLIQPKINNKYELSALYGKTDSNGRYIFTPTMMTKAGTYEYLLSQMTEDTNYESMGNVTLKITFNELGEVTQIEKKYNDKVTAEKINDSYVKVNVANVNKLTNVFDFELELSDNINNNSKIEGAIYNIEVTTQDGGTKTYQNQVTDVDGKINLTLSGSGYIQIKVTEVLNKVGYYSDTVVKEMIVFRQNGALQFIARTVPTDLDVQLMGNKVKLNLTSEMNANPSAIRVQVTDMQEHDIFLPGTTVKLIGTMTNEEYTGVTDQDGIVTFLIQPQNSNGTGYQYKIEVDNNTIPNGYSPITDNILVNVEFDENNEIKDVSDISGPIFKTEKINYVQDNFNYNAAYVGVGVEINEEDAYNFVLKLTDEDNGTAISGATYNIKIDNGVTVRNIVGRPTNSSGTISTRLVSSESLTITVQEIKSKESYIADSTEQVIVLRKVNGEYIIDNQNPYDYSDNKNGAKIEEKNIVYYHTNAKKDNDSVLLNVYVNKMDEDDNLLGNVRVKISSDTLKNSAGATLNEILQTDQNGYIELEGIKVTNIEIPKDSEHFLYITEVDGLDNEIEKTKVKLKLTFRYNENKQIVEITNAESTWGNRLVKNKTFNGYESAIAYESNLYLDIYGNYDDVGNFSLDLRKKNQDGFILEGAKYDVVITRPDATKVIKRDLEITDSVEFSGIFVTEGTIIEITEIEEPLGYKINEHTEIIRISQVADNGQVSVELQSSGYKFTTAAIADTQVIPIDDATVKTCLTLDLIDESLNTFKFGITTIDTDSLKGVKDFKYNIFTSKGAQVDTEVTNSQGKVSTLVGASYTDQTVIYTITETQTAKYYKPLKDPITLKIVFASDGKIDSIETLAVQTDTNYKVTWEIETTNNEDGNDIEIKIFNEPQDPLNVKLNAIDKITGDTISNVKYKIEPSVNLPATGSTDETGSTEIAVGYVAPRSIQSYTLKQMTNMENYRTIDTQSFRILYDDNGDISVDPSNVTSSLEFVSRQGKTVEFNVYLEPKVPIVINSIGYFDNLPLEGSQYTISSTGYNSNTVTKIDGKASTFNGILGEDSYITYTITETKVTQGYVMIDPIQVKVHFNSNREIDDVSLLGASNRWVQVGFKTPSIDTDLGYNGNDKGIVQITIKHYPEFLINIENKDRLDNTVKLSGTLYSVESDIGTSDNEVITDQDGIGVARLDKTLIDNKITYTIKEKRPASLYQSIEKDVIVEVIFDDNGYVTSTQVVQGEDFATATKIQNITDPRDNFKINVVIENCKMIKFNITAVDSENQTYPLRGLTFEAKSTLNSEQLASSSMQTDINGQGTLGLDKDYANETITYTIKETKKLPGYQFPAEDLIIEVTFDSDGKIIPSTVKMLQGAVYTEILNIDADEFIIDLKIVNDETDEFGLYITAVDKYDESVKVKDVNYETYLMTADYQKDTNYAGNAVTDANGEAYIQYGKYVSSNPNGSETRSIRIFEANLSNKYREIRGAIVVNVTFDANGIVQDVSVPGGYNTYIGWVADNRFISVTHTRHTVSVTIKHYPYLFMNVKAQDIYTGDELAGKYKISTTKGPGYSYIDSSKIPMQEKIAKVQEEIYKTENRGATLTDLINAMYKDSSIEKIKLSADGQTATFTIGQTIYTVDSTLEVTKAQTPGNYSTMTGYTNIDYIGYGIGEILTQNYETTDDGNWLTLGVGPAEKSTSRTYYIYEEEAPSTPMLYQQYRPRYLSWEYSKIIASITVKYNEKGRIESYELEEDSYNNIQQFINIEIIDGLNLGITIKYAPTTVMEVTTIDNVSKVGLSNIRVSPYGNNSYATRQSYEYRTIGYYTTDANGQTNYTYWGANIDNSQNEYHINTSLMGYKGYFGTGLIKIHVAYDEYGRISAADVLTKDGNGMPNAEIVDFENNKLIINILYNRKLNLKIDKQDAYDENTKLIAQFNIKSNANDDVTLTSNNLTAVGMIRPGERVKYTLSETVVPQNYLPLENIEFYITYNKDGTIKDVTSTSPLFDVIDKREITDAVRATTVEDLKIAVKNEPRFTIKMNVMDRYYNEIKLSGVSFTVTNDKGDTAIGNPVTDSSGKLITYVGKTFRNETVTYTIKQISTPNGYYENLKDIVIKVEFNEQGKISNYYIVNGDNNVKIDEKRYQNERYIEIDNLLNMPRYLKVGIENYDKTTGESIPGITYKVTAQDAATNSLINEKDFITNENGVVIDSINEFKETQNKQRIINYTISQITIPSSYRKIQDVVIQVTFNEDGSIASRNVLSNPTNVKIDVTLGGKLKYLKNEPVNILLSMPNDNAYDLIIKNEDKNYPGLGIPDVKYDVTVNGDKLELTTNSYGIASSLTRKETGEITIRIAETEPGVGYSRDVENDTIIVLEKGEEEYSLKSLSNSNPTNADVVVDEQHGTVTVIFKNDTRSSLTLVKDENEVRYEITSKEKLSDGTYTNQQLIGTDMSDPIAQESLYYELGVTPQNKIIVYNFKQLNLPVGYDLIGEFDVTVEYDIYGDIVSISDNSSRVESTEIEDGSHDIVVIVSEYNSDGSGGSGGSGGTDGSRPSEEKYKFSTLTVVKDNKDVRYEISLKIVDDKGNTISNKVIINDLNDVTAKEQLYYELQYLQPNTQFIISIKELSIPDDYISNGVIEINGKVNDKGYVEQLTDNSDNAEVKLAPADSNYIIVVIGKEYGSLTLLKDNAEVKYNTSSFDKNSDGTYTNEEVLGTEPINGDSKKIVYFSFRKPTIDKTKVYRFTELSIPQDYTSKGIIEVESVYDTQGDITSLNANNQYVTAQKSPKDSLNIVANILTEDEINDIEESRIGYTIKIASQEVDTNLRINDSTFDIDIFEGQANLIKELKGARTGNISKKGYLLEKGVIQVEDVKKAGDITIDIDQVLPTADGYKFGNQVTSGTVIVNVSYNNPSIEPQISMVSDGNLKVDIDNLNKIITVKVFNEPESLMQINNVVLNRNSDGDIVEEPLKEAKFTITSKIQTRTDITDTDLNVTTAKTDENGDTQAKVGTPYAGKTVLYNIHQMELDQYAVIDDIIVLVEYDTKGLIKYLEVISNPDDAEVLGELGTRNIQVKVKNELISNKYGYKIIIEKHHIDDGYYEELIPGAKFKIEVEQEYGTYNTTWEDITDEEGIITSSLFDGYGYITVKLTELDPPEGFKYYNDVLEFRVNRNKNTGIFTPISSDVNYEFSEDNSIIYLRPVNEPKDELYTIIANKADKKTGQLITESAAEFEVKMYEQENIGTEDEPVFEEVETYLGTFQTNNKGKAKIENQLKPEKAGIYKYVITETRAPAEYVPLEEPVVLQIEFVEDEKGAIQMGESQILSGDASIKSKKDDLLNITINNLNEKDVNKYTLDITKVDAETNEPIENMAIFKVWLPDSQNTAVYTETMANEYGVGKLDYCYIEQDKDYEVRLTRMEIPLEETTLKYVFREITPPEGYNRIEEDMELNIEFKKDEDTNKMYIASMTSSNDDYLRINTPAPCPVDTVISIDILNNSESNQKYTIHYDANDNGEGTVVPEDQTKEKGIDLTLSTAVPTREGHTFKGWTTIQTDTNVQFTPGSIYTLDQDITLYAVWEEDLYLKSTEYLIGNGVNPNGFWNPGDETQYKDGDLYIKGIRPQSGLRLYKDPSNAGTYLPELLSNLTTNADEIKVYIPEKDESGNIILKDENIVGDRRLIGTGMIIKLTKGEQEIQLTLIVRGDLLSASSTVGNGRTDNVEAQRLRTLTGSTLTKDYTIEEQQAIDYFINTDIRWNVNKQAINNAYQKHTLVPIR